MEELEHSSQAFRSEENGYTEAAVKHSDEIKHSLVNGLSNGYDKDKKERDKHKEKHHDREKDKHGDRDKHRSKDGDRDKHKEKHKDSKDRDREKDKHREKDRDKERDKSKHSSSSSSKFPKSEEEWKVIARGFHERWNFPNCLGAIDGKHVPIVPPPGSGSFFFNYKKFHSQVLLAIADCNYRLIYFSFGVNGRVSDGGVLACCDINKKMVEKTLSVPKPTMVDGILLPYVFVADEAFELREDLMKPFNASVLNYERRICNYRFSRARRIVENVFGILVARFGVFQKPINLRLDRITDVVLACCALHNFLRETTPNKYTPSECFDEESNGIIINGLRMETRRKLQRNRKGTKGRGGNNTRDQFVRYFNGNGKVPWQDKYV